MSKVRFNSTSALPHAKRVSLPFSPEYERITSIYNAVFFLRIEYTGNNLLLRNGFRFDRSVPLPPFDSSIFRSNRVQFVEAVLSEGRKEERDECLRNKLKI